MATEHTPQSELQAMVEEHGEALYKLSAVMLKHGLFPEKSNDLTDAYEAVVVSWGKLTLLSGGEPF